ncbi:hypothetical protein BS50DRAFT_491107 [Corynespora cassiicola Philippines]|uniref:NOT2/NOT3/NOT5 C-terminal domain-containing protein n=1 Tax=Corynespora cassiicola Philippines TaxID=1448308 RepID=A0A2T2NW12_CORCC|nr:hypothetical protein BS50DRAFT_491107 [Corynespora cassiicola Philippines]
MFQNQQNNGRGAPLGSNRLQNGKLGSGSQWAFGGPMGGAPGLSQSRANGGGPGLSSFAQTIGNSQPHTPLNLEEFPSLSGAPQAQQNTSAQQMWSNPNLRTTQHSTIQRPQGQGPPQGQPGQTADRQLQSQSHEEAVGSGQGQFSGGGDEYRFGGSAGVGQLSGGHQPQTGNIEEFPPLGGGGNGEVGPDRRTGMIQNAAAYGGSTNSTAFPGLGQTRNGLSSPTEGQQDRSINPSVAGRGQHSGVSRTPLESLRGTPTGLQDNNPRSGQTLGNLSNFVGPVGQRPQQSQMDQNYGGESLGSPNAQQAPQHKKLSEMTESERYGLPGLLSTIPFDSPDYSSLALGQDLTVLGLDLSRPDNSPLHPTFGSPFVESNMKPVIPPDFTLPAAYTVTNVPPLHTKMSSFSAETLLAIFYQYPRDILQEIAANELFSRDWRWHTKLQQWMMKDPDLPQPIRISPKEERGWYLFFDVTNWRRERVCVAFHDLLLTMTSDASLIFTMSSIPEQDTRIYLSLKGLYDAVREMNPAGAKPIPAQPNCFNFLARPHLKTCHVCSLAGHSSENAHNATACRIALMSTIRFWENMSSEIIFLYKASTRFNNAIKSNVATYDMRLNNSPVVGGSMETVLVHSLTHNYLNFQAHCARIRAKANLFLNEVDLCRYDEVSETLNKYLLNGYTLTDLCERSVADKQ